MKTFFSKFHESLAVLLVVGMTLGLHACNSSDSDDADVVNAYNGPGSKWDVLLRDDDTFTITRRPNPDRTYVAPDGSKLELGPAI